MQKGMQKWTVIAIVVILSIALVGTSFAAIFQPQAQTPDEEQSLVILEQEYQVRKEKVETLSNKLKESPEDRQIKIALGDAYYEKSIITGRLNMNEYKEDLEKAIDIYQDVLKTENDQQILLKLANSAFLLGEQNLAGKSYTDLLSYEPENVDALYGYGMFLLYEKGDHKEAQKNWEKALTLTTDEQMKLTLERMVTLAKGMDIPEESEPKDK